MKRLIETEISSSSGDKSKDSSPVDKSKNDTLNESKYNTPEKSSDHTPDKSSETPPGLQSSRRGRSPLNTTPTARTQHFLPRRLSSRDRSPHMIADRLTGYRSPGRSRRGRDYSSPSPARDLDGSISGGSVGGSGGGRGPYDVTRITSPPTPPQRQASLDSEDDERPLYMRIAQPYRTSFSAVTCITSPPPGGSANSSVTSPGSSTLKVTLPVLKSQSSSAARNYATSAGTFPRRGLNHPALPNKIKYGGYPLSAGKTATGSPSQKSGSADLLSCGRVGDQQVGDNREVEQTTCNRSASCDLLDGGSGTNRYPCTSTPNSQGTYATSNANSFENRRFQAKYSSTPAHARGGHHSKPPVVRSMEHRHDTHHDTRHDTRLDSNVSSATADSVFESDSVHRGPNGFSSGELSGELSSRATDSGFTDGYVASSGPNEGSVDNLLSATEQEPLEQGEVQRKWLVEREYATTVILTHAELKKMRKRRELPEPNAETAEIVRQLQADAEARRKARQEQGQQNGYPPEGQCEAEVVDLDTGNGPFSRSRWRQTIGKKVQSINTFLRRLHSPRTPRSGEKSGESAKRAKRSKSASRLEGNRIYTRGTGSNSSIGGEPTSCSSDQSSSVFYTAALNEPIRGSDTKSSKKVTKSSKTVKSNENLFDNNKAVRNATLTPVNGASESSTAVTGSKTTQARRILRSLEENSAKQPDGGDKSVYRTFKEKRSPAYSRHGDVLAMRNHALRAIDIPLSDTDSIVDKRGSMDELSTPGEANTRRNDLTRPRDLGKTVASLGGRNNVTTSQPITAQPPAHLQNGHLAQATYTPASYGESNYKNHSGPVVSSDYPHQPSSSSSSGVNNNHPAITSNYSHTTKSGGVNNNTDPHSGYQHNSGAADSHNFTENSTNSATMVTGGDPVVLEYHPGDSSHQAYVKKVTQRFEQRNIQESPANTTPHTTQKTRPKQDSSSTQQGQTAVTSRRGHDLSVTSATADGELSVTSPSTLIGASSHASHTYEQNVLQDGGKNLENGDSTVDSDNINFRQARQAFNHDTPVSRSPKLAPKQRVGYSVHSEHESSRGTPSSQTPLNGDVFSPNDVITHSYDVKDNAITSHMLCHDDIVSANRIIIVDNETSPFNIESAEDSSNITFSNDLTTNSYPHLIPAHTDTENQLEPIEQTLDNTMHSCETEVTTHLNGDVVNGQLSEGTDEEQLDDREVSAGTPVETLSKAGSTDSLDPRKDGDYFRGQMESEARKINELCERAEQDLNTHMSEEAAGKVRAAIGKANLLTAKKFKQFRGLCERNLTQGSNDDFRTTCQDLAGFWDMVLIQVQDIHNNFSELDRLRDNNWQLAYTPEVSPVLSTPKSAKSAKPRSARSTTKSPAMSEKAGEAARAREEARRQLLQAKKAGRRQRQNSDGSDAIEVEIVT